MIKEFGKHFRQFRIIFDLHEQIDFRKFLETVFKIALYKTACDDQFLQAVLFVFGDLQDRVDRFSFRRKDEAAGVDQDCITFFQII